MYFRLAPSKLVHQHVDQLLSVAFSCQKGQKSSIIIAEHKLGARPRLKTCYPEDKQSILVNKQESSWKGQTPGFIAGEERRRKAQNHMFYVGN